MGKFASLAGTATRPQRSASRLRLGTCLPGTAALLLIGLPAVAEVQTSPLVARTLATPQPAAAASRPLPEDLTVRAPLQPSRPQPVQPLSGVTRTGSPLPAAGASAPVHDLTIRPAGRGGDVAVTVGTVHTTADYDHGVATLADGATTIAADRITTSGTRADGIHAVGYGDMAIEVGRVATSGYRSAGIYANTNMGGATGGITVSAGSVSTQGVGATGISAAAYQGAVGIDVHSVKTSGYGAEGINAWSYQQDVTIDAGKVVTRGDAARGIVGYSGGTTTISVDTVTTRGAGVFEDANATGIKAVGAAVAVSAGTVRTRGDLSVGIYAISNRVHDNGQENRDITVAAGSVSTRGSQSDGIDAINYGAGGKTSVTANAVSTRGDASWGVYAGGLGNVSIDVGSVATRGENAAGVVGVSVYGDLAISAGSVTVKGAHGNAINANNYSQNGSTTISVGSVRTRGDASSGIYVGGSNGYQGASHLVTVDAGSISTDGDLAAGLVILTGGDVTATVGDVTTNGPRSRGIIVTTGEGDVNLTAGSIVTKGDPGLGFDAVGLAISDNGGNVNAEVGAISTHGDHSPGILANGYASNQTFTFRDGITTVGNNADGAFFFLDHGNLSVDSGAITTSGDVSHGVRAYVFSGDAAVHVGTISTAGDGSLGVTLQAVSTDGKAHRATVDVGSVSTTGYTSNGVLVLAQGDNVDVTAGSVTTLGNDAAGIAVAAGHGTKRGGASYGGHVTVHAGTVSTSGKGANGIDTVATKGTKITAETVTTTGAGAAGIHAVGNGPIGVEVGSLATSGKGADGIYAVTQSGDVRVTSGSVAATGLLSQGIRAASYDGNVTVNAGAVTGGVGTGIDARAGYGAHGSATVTAGTIVTRGAGIVALAGDDVTIDVGSVTTYSGTKDAGTQLGQAIKAVAHGGIDIKAGTVATTGYWAEGVYALAGSYGDSDRAPGNITIDVGSMTTSGARSDGVFAIDTGYRDGGHQSVTVTAGPVSTSGESASGIYAVGPNVSIAANGAVSTQGDRATGVYAAAVGGTATIVAGAVSTHGDYAAGVRGFASNGAVDITTTGPITTTGRNSYGVLAFGTADLSITNSGTIDTIGQFGRGLYAISSTGGTTIANAGAIHTSGEMAEGIRAISFADGVTVTSTGTITTSGDYSAGIIAGRDRSGRGDREAQATEPVVPTVTVTAGTIATSGARSNGISAVNYAFGGKTSVSVDQITTTGDSSAGVASVTFGDLAIRAGDIRSTGNAIYARTIGDYLTTVSVDRSAVSTGNTAISLSTSGGEGVVTVAKGAQVVGGGTRDPIYGGGDGVFVSGGEGTATINNAGTIVTTAANGYAIEEIGSADYYSGRPTFAITVNNSGTIRGAVKLDSGADVVNNSGLFAATKDSDFGGGRDRFLNTGTVMVVPGAKPAQVAFRRLRTFENAGGLVDLRNGTAGDVLKLSGAYVGSGGARLGLDLSGTTADTLVVAGAATGKTVIDLNLADGDARLLAAPVTLVQTGSGSAADAFSLATTDVGLIHYGLRFDAASGRLGLTGVAGAPVYRTLNLQRGAEAVWTRMAEGWESQTASRRDLRWAGGTAPGKLWGQMFGGVTTQDGHRDVAGTRTTTSFRQDYYGAQLGLDLGGRTSANGGSVVGVTASYISSKLNSRVSPDRTQFDTLGLGGYAGIRSGPFFADLLGQYAHHWIDTRNAALSYRDTLDGDSYGANLQLGVRFGSPRLFVEPVATLAYTRSDLGNVAALKQTIDFDRYDGLRGKLGGRIGSTRDLGTGKATFYLQGRWVHEFEGEGGATFRSGGTSQSIAGIRPGDYGQGSAGVEIFSRERFSGFLEGNADFGASKGGGGRVGVTFRL